MFDKTNIHSSWLEYLAPEFEAPYMQKLQAFLMAEKQAGKVLYPAETQVFNAFNSTPFNNVKVVILGQDPYHGPNQAHGLCFSVARGVAAPPSLVNIFKEIERDLAIEAPNHGCLQAWAEQGVLLLNATLTVEQGKAGAHQKQGWEIFTDKVISLLNDHGENIVFFLWGSYAQKKGAYINKNKHLVLVAPHPSPLSAYRGFIGCGHFSSANRYLKSKGIKPVEWGLQGK